MPDPSRPSSPTDPLQTQPQHVQPGPSSSRHTVPPSEPRPSRQSFGMIDVEDRPARLQMIVALVLILVLVAIPLYLWRRPRAESIQVGVASPDAGVAVPVNVASPPPEEHVTIGDAKILSCHDPGPKKTPVEQCDHLVEFEKAFAKAIEESASCVPKESGGGSLTYLADATFKKKTVTLTLPKEGRALKLPKLTAACEKAVKGRLGAFPLENVQHQHARYRIAITATYPAAKP